MNFPWSQSNNTSNIQQQQNMSQQQSLNQQNNNLAGSQLGYYPVYHQVSGNIMTKLSISDRLKFLSEELTRLQKREQESKTQQEKIIQTQATLSQLSNHVEPLVNLCQEYLANQNPEDLIHIDKYIKKLIFNNKLEDLTKD